MKLNINAIQTNTGIIGYFDVLGYESFLENNSSEDGIKNVLKTISTIDENTIEDFISAFKSVSIFSDLKRIFVEEFETRIFSDTIIVFARYKENEENELKLLRWFLFIIFGEMLYSKMFEFGLPVRGAIGFGKYSSVEYCFAGRPIIETYKQARELDLSACVFIESAEKEFDSLSPLSSIFADFFKEILPKYSVPLKNSQTKNLYTLLKARTNQNTSLEIKEQVKESFKKHKKSITLREESKITNTTDFFNFLNLRKQYNQING
ncbi:MAG: hypothetical protein H3C68_05750 [Deltaproteobacteria bacterium]|nr:hypothetical protein [Deltaproteobacteria bacterium]MBZ0220232.1 hypothetical protein [Deltaproteobacteria bacterium]